MIGTLEFPPREIEYVEPVMIYDLAHIVNMVYQQNVEPTKGGYLPKRLSNKIRPLLQGRPRYNYDGSDDYVDMLLTLLVNIHVLHAVTPPQGDMKTRIVPGRGFSSWAKMELEEQAACLVTVWVSQRLLFDATGVDYDPWDSTWGPSVYTRDTRSGRQTLLESLRECVPGTWYSTESLLEKLWKERPLALYHLSATQQKEEVRRVKMLRDHWLQTDGQLYIGMLESTLRDIGLIIPGYDEPVPVDEQGKMCGFMVTELGAMVIKQVLTDEMKRTASNVSATTTHALIVQPDFELFLLHPHFPTLYAVLPFAQLHQVGSASRLTLTKSSLLRGIAAGQKIERIVQMLAEVSQKELPQNVVYTLQDWAKLYKETQVSQAVLLETPDEATASQLCASARLQKFGVRQLAPCVVALDGDANLQEVRNALEKEGVTPQLLGNFVRRDP